MLYPGIGISLAGGAQSSRRGAGARAARTDTALARRSISPAWTPHESVDNIRIVDSSLIDFVYSPLLRREPFSSGTDMSARICNPARTIGRQCPTALGLSMASWSGVRVGGLHPVFGRDVDGVSRRGRGAARHVVRFDTVPGQFSGGTSSASLTGSRRDSTIRAPSYERCRFPAVLNRGEGGT